ncbi:MAG: glycoside hydrolase family 9 protein [Acidobacteriota bacterium]
MNRTAARLTALALLLSVIITARLHAQIYVRANQIGYLPDDVKIAVAFSHEPAEGRSFELVDIATNRVAFGPVKLPSNHGAYANFQYNYQLDFSSFKKEGRYKVRITGTSDESLPFALSKDAYNTHHESLLFFMREQRCGYNPFLDEVCHKKDGRTAYGPMPDSTYVDVSGGWHDAADQLRYLMTSGNAVCRMLFAYEENKGKYRDDYNALGQKGSNGIPDILDEAKWGLDWMLKMHPAPDQLFHQVADDRDHMYGGLPPNDTSDYGWGFNSYRVTYFATGKPQGLRKYQNTSDGVANLAGRYAAAMAMAYRIWMNDLKDPGYAQTCLRAGREVYELGVKQPGSQEGVPCISPYRYMERTWADDMEWGAAELYAVTREKRFLEEGKRYARLIATTSWMGKDTSGHYEMFPFMNMGHYALWKVADKKFKDTLAGYYRTGIEDVWKKAKGNAFEMGVPFIWCSFNLVVDFTTQCILYEKMTKDKSYNHLQMACRDWLLGRNPWGVSAFVGVPRNGNYPKHPHNTVSWETGREITGALNDGPVYGSIYKYLSGVRLSKPDEYAPFQSDLVVYHDDMADYSTNEPIMDGTAGATFFMAWYAHGK